MNEGKQEEGGQQEGMRILGIDSHEGEEKIKGKYTKR